MDMVLAKSDLAVAARYVELVPDRRVAKKIFSAIEAEWQRTAQALTLITGDKERLAGNPSLARSIAHRFPYLDPLNHLQVELMRRYRAHSETGAAETSACSAVSTCRSTGWRRACEIRAEAPLEVDDGRARHRAPGRRKA